MTGRLAGTPHSTGYEAKTVEDSAFENKVHVDNLDDFDILSIFSKIKDPDFVINPICRLFLVEMKESPQGTCNGKPFAWRERRQRFRVLSKFRK